MHIRHAGREDKIELQMTPMIDIVFQLLVFFVMTFKIVQPEGDFNIRMPSASESVQIEPSEKPTIYVRLTADENGALESLAIREGDLGNYRSLDSFQTLRERIRRSVGDAAGPDAEASDQEVELDCDYDLEYRYVMDAITHISGYVDYRTKTQHKLVERIRFAPVEEP